MDNKENIMSIEEEENFLIDKLQSARHALRLHKEAASQARFVQNRLEKELADIEQACIDYMAGNGLLETKRLRLSETHSVDVTDIEAVPEMFVRVKTTKEPNKILIKELVPQGNWYTMAKGYKLTVKGQNNDHTN